MRNTQVFPPDPTFIRGRDSWQYPVTVLRVGIL